MMVYRIPSTRRHLCSFCVGVGLLEDLRMLLFGVLTRDAKLKLSRPFFLAELQALDLRSHA